MTKAKLNKIIIATSIFLAMIFACHEKAYAKFNRDEVVKKVYEQVVKEGKTKYTFYCDDRSQIQTEFYDALHAIDDEDELYDGIMLDLRGDEKIVRHKNNKFSYKMENSFTPEEADKLIDKMVEEIKEKLPEDATDRETFYEIGKYISTTYSYDFYKYFTNQKYTNFIDAYDGDRKISCEGFAALTYLLSKKLGVDVILYYGRNHVYNGIRFDGDDKYMAVDFASFPNGFVPGLFLIDPAYNERSDYSLRKAAPIKVIMDSIGYGFTH